MSLNCPEVLLVELALSFVGVTSGRLAASGTKDEICHQIESCGATHVIWHSQFKEKREIIANAMADFRLTHLSMDLLIKKPERVHDSKRISTYKQLLNFRNSLNCFFGEKKNSSPAEIFFSSGTTGLPKAIDVSQRSFCINILMMK